jgi:hypothetical protein
VIRISPSMMIDSSNLRLKTSIARDSFRVEFSKTCRRGPRTPGPGRPNHRSDGAAPQLPPQTSYDGRGRLTTPKSIEIAQTILTADEAFGPPGT